MKSVTLLIFIIILSIPGSPQRYLNYETHDVDSLLAVLPGQVGEERFIP